MNTKYRKQEEMKRKYKTGKLQLLYKNVNSVSTALNITPGVRLSEAESLTVISLLN